MRFEIDWASLIVGGKFTVFALFYFVFKGNFPSTNPPESLYLEGRFDGGFLRYRFGGLIFGGAHTFRGLFSKFYGISVCGLQLIVKPSLGWSGPRAFIRGRLDLRIVYRTRLHSECF